MPGGVVARFVYRETRQVEKIQKEAMVSFFLGVAPERKRRSYASRKLGDERLQEVAAVLAGLVKLFSPRTEELLSNIHGSIWHQTVPRPSVSMGFRKMFRKRVVIFDGVAGVYCR